MNSFLLFFKYMFAIFKDRYVGLCFSEVSMFGCVEMLNFLFIYCNIAVVKCKVYLDKFHCIYTMTKFYLMLSLGSETKKY